MEAGDYKLRFGFQLPEDIPSSLKIKGKKDPAILYDQQPKASIRYLATVSLQNNSLGSMVLEKELHIRETPKPLEEDKLVCHESSSTMDSCFCCGSGTSKMTAKFNKNVFSPQEKAEVELTIDNTACSLACHTITFKVTNTLKMTHNNGQSCEIEKTIFEKS